MGFYPIKDCEAGKRKRKIDRQIFCSHVWGGLVLMSGIGSYGSRLARKCKKCGALDYQ